MINSYSVMCSSEMNDLKDIHLIKAYSITKTLNTNSKLTNSDKLLLCSKQLAYMKEYLYSINGINKLQYKAISKLVVVRIKHIFRSRVVCDNIPYRKNFFEKVMEFVKFPNVTNTHWDRLKIPSFFLGKRIKNALKRTHNWFRIQLNTCYSFIILANKYKTKIGGKIKWIK